MRNGPLTTQDIFKTLTFVEKKKKTTKNQSEMVVMGLVKNMKICS